jgi:Fic family protein
MKSFVDIDATLAAQPARLGVLLQRVDVGRGREELFTDQLPELLSALAEQTRVASIRASNAIEGINVDAERAERLAGGAKFRNRSEREFAGYRDAIDGLMRATPEPVSVPLLLHLHRQIFLHADGHGGEFKHDDNAIVSYSSGRRELIFQPVSKDDAPFMTSELVDRYLEAQQRQLAHPLVLLGMFVLDLLAIHPVADGNGRLARLATTHELLQLDYGVTRFVSIEQQIFETKNAYYASLAESQRGWHEARHDVWPWIEYLVGTLAEGYERFEARVASARGDAGASKQERVCTYVRQHAAQRFTIGDIRKAVPGISDPTIRIALNELRAAGEITPEGFGRAAGWRRQAPTRP